MLDLPRCAGHAGTGIGKTSSTLAALDTLLLAGESRKVLVLGPKRVAQDTWTDEAAKWVQFQDLRFSRIMGTPAERVAGLRANADIYLMNYEQLPWLVDRLGGDWPFDTVVADESTKLKGFRLNQGAQRTRALGKVAHRHVRRFIELTGTPAPNGLVDLWPQLWFVDGGKRLGRTFTAFTERWFTTGRDGFSLQPLPHAFDEISALIGDVCVSIQAKDYFDIREPVVSNIEVHLPPKALTQYKEMEREMFLEIANTGVEAFNAASRTIKCLQLASGTILLDDKGKWVEVHRAKIEALESIIEEAAGMPVLVSYSFVADRERLLAHFKGAVDLATPEGMRKFKAGQAPVGIGHPASIGHGIDGLQLVTNIIVFFSSDYNLENRQQIIERIGPTRQFQAGLDRPTFVYNLIARGTLDDMVLARVETKREVQDLLMDRLKGEQR
jgi:hypothetical protein